MNTNTVAPTRAKVTVEATKRCPAGCEHGHFYEGDYHGNVTNTITCERCNGKGRVKVTS